MPQALPSARTSWRRRSRASVRARSSASTIVSAPAFGLPSMSPPIQVPSLTGGGAPGIASPQLAHEPRQRLPEARLDEPEPVPDLVDDARPPRADLVRLPEDRHLLARSARAPAAGSSAAARDRRAGAVPLPAAGAPGGSSGGSPRSGAPSARAAPRAAQPRRAARRRHPRLAQLRHGSRRATRAGPVPRARTDAAGAAGGAARRCSRAGRRARTPAAPDCCSRSRPRIVPSSSLRSPASRASRARPRIRSSSASSSSPSCSTSTSRARRRAGGRLPGAAPRPPRSAAQPPGLRRRPAAVAPATSFRRSVWATS